MQCVVEYLRTQWHLFFFSATWNQPTTIVTIQAMSLASELQDAIPQSDNEE